MNTQQAINQWSAALQLLIDDSEISDSIRAAVKTALSAFEKSQNVYSQHSQKSNATLLELRNAEKDLSPQLVQELQNGKRVTLDARVEHVETLRAAWETSQVSLTAATQAHRHITSQVCGLVLKPFTDELLQWVARRRDSDPVACGEIDALNAQVQLVYATIQPRWRTDWDAALALGTTSRLPLIYDARWTSEYRSSLAWVWSQVAQGHVHKVPSSTSRQPNAPALFLAPTHRVIDLPTVPPVPPVPTQNQLRFLR